MHPLPLPGGEDNGGTATLCLRGRWRLVAAGVRGILNFAPRKLRVPEGITLRNVDMTMEFESLSFVLSQTRGKPRRRAGE